MTNVYRCIEKCRVQMKFEGERTTAMLIEPGTIATLEIKTDKRVTMRPYSDATAFLFVPRATFDRCFEGKQNIQAAIAANKERT